ncbi:methyltransferase domain-containing protein [bacterium]|nr:methyltransferase domain-containing protein [bacterium]
MSDTREAGYYGYARPDVLALIPPGCRRLLDLGCGRGELGRRLQGRDGALRITGIEWEPAAARVAAGHYDRVLVGSLEGELPRLVEAGERFDLIVMADILEHTAAPGTILAQAATLLIEGGHAVVSVPNVSHYSVGLGLLRDRWDYAERGILDRGHLRFFTQRSFRELARSAGLSVLRERRNYRLWERRGLRHDRWVAIPISLGLLRHLFVFQNLFLLRKGD